MERTVRSLMHTQLYNPKAYGSVSVLPTRFFFLLSNAMTLTFDPETQ
jgi:hypothetical protein